METRAALGHRVIAVAPVSPGAVLEADDGAFGSHAAHAIPVAKGTRVQVQAAGPDGALHVARLTAAGRLARGPGGGGTPARFRIRPMDRGRWRLVRLVPL